MALAIVRLGAAAVWFGGGRSPCVVHSWMDGHDESPESLSRNRSMLDWTLGINTLCTPLHIKS
jgi:hypothetical protein